MKSNIINKESIISLFLFFASLILFLTTICPNMYWRDAPEFQVVAYQLGIAHPAGSPLYALLAKIFTFLPLGSIAFKVNLFSAFFGALIILLTFLLVIECLELIFPLKSRNLFLISGAIAVSFYAASNSLWHNSIVAEVYTLQNCFIISIAIFLLRGLRKEKKSFLYLSGFLFGLSTGAHIIMILYIPALFLFLWLFHRKCFSLSQLGIILMFVTLGASVYLYLPVRSSVDPYYDWGDPENAKNFITHVTDRKDTKRHFFFSPEKFIKNLKKYGRYYLEDFHVLGIALGLTGLVIFFRKSPKLFLGLGTFLFSQWFFFIRYWPWSSAFIATFLLFTIYIAVGICGIIQRFQSVTSRNTVPGSYYRFLPGTLIILCTIQIIFLGCLHWKKNNKADYWSPYDFYHYLYNQIEYRGILANSLYYFGTSYLQQCENYRPDVTNLFLSEVLSPRLFNSVTPERYPLITIPHREGPKIGEAIINANVVNHPFYWDPNSRINYVVKDNLHPDGLLFRITPSPSSISVETKEFHIKKIEEFFSEYTSVFSHYRDPEENLLYSLTLESLSRFFFERQEYILTIAHLSVANRLTPETIPILNGLASAHASLGRFAKAEVYFKKALNINPLHAASLQNLGQLYLDTGQYSAALACYQRILEKEPENPKAHFNIGVYYEKIKNIDKARDAFQKVITLSPEDSLALKARKKLSVIDQ